MLTKKQKRKASHVRKECAGYIGGPKIANKATDEQVLALVKLQDDCSVLQNVLTGTRRKQANLIKSIKNS